MELPNFINTGATGAVFSWDKNYLFKVLTEGKHAPITLPNVALAFRNIDRADFVPFKLKEQAYQDLDLDIGHGEKFTRPTVLAKMVNLLEPNEGGSYLDVGTGTGYFAILLGFLAGPSGKVFTLERVQWLWEQARQNASHYKKINNIKFLYRDGMSGLPEQAPYDGIHFSFSIENVPLGLKMQLKVGAKMIVPGKDYNIRVIKRMGQEDFEEEIIPGIILQEGKEGVA